MNIDTPGKTLTGVWFVLEVEHRDDDECCTVYHRETVLPKLYLTKESAELAIRYKEAAKREDDGEIYGRHGNIYYSLYKADIIPGDNGLPSIGASFWEPLR